ncbi:MAG: response regulator [Anaerolineae bacterium]|nr:response regulator [Anaerolineae bacterium]
MIETTELNAQLLCEMLELFGHRAVPACISRASDALTLVRMYQPRLVITELFLPHTSGLDVLRELRAEHHTESLPIVVLTTSDSQAEAMQAGANLFVQKPFEAEQFVGELNSLLVKYRSLSRS